MSTAKVVKISAFEKGKINESKLSLEYLKEHFHYCPNTGIFTRIKNNSNYISKSKLGQPILTLSHGYIRITINNIKYSAHRLAWFYTFGKFPENCLDHIDRNPANNRIDNLRECTIAENQQNITPHKNTSSIYTGVYFRKDNQKWGSRININRQRVHLGFFDTETEAHEAYLNAKAKYHEFVFR